MRALHSPLASSLSSLSLSSPSPSSLSLQSPFRPSPLSSLSPLPLPSSSFPSSSFPSSSSSFLPLSPPPRLPTPLASASSDADTSTADVADADVAGGDVALTYRAAGVDIDAGAELVRRIAKMAPGIGGFGGLFPFGDHYLVAGTDGVGTKLKIAFSMGVHDTIGIDLVAMSVNDIITSGATPLFFLDYFASSRLDVDQAEQVIKGIVEGCKQSGCALLGGETAEMPGFYSDGEYDLSGFAVGSVLKTELIDGSKIALKDKIVALPSSGLHSNGFSLARRVLEKSGASLDDYIFGDEKNGKIGSALLAPTKIYVQQVLEILKGGGVKAIAHITGGGFTDNIPRVFPDGFAAKLNMGTWNPPLIFEWLQKEGNIETSEMRRTFNMGIGMILVMSPEAAERVEGGENGGGPAFIIGEVVEGEEVVYVESS